MPKLHLPERPVPLGSVILVSGVLNRAPAEHPSLPDVRVAETEAPVALPPKPGNGKPAARRGEPPPRPGRPGESEVVSAKPLIPPADLSDGPPPAREPLSLDTSFEPLAAGGFTAARNPVTPAGPEPSAGSSAASGAAPASAPDTKPVAAARPAPPPPASPKETATSKRILFQPNATDLPAGAEGELNAIVAAANGEPNSHVHMTAYASGDADGGNQARRTSLSRALAVRAYLIQQGLPSGRIEVRALGNRSEGGPGDRVDLRVGGP